MAKSKIDLVCARCGETFVHSKNVRNSDEKVSYEEWARKHIDLCPDCLKKTAIENAVEGGDAVVERMLYKEYKANWATCKTVPDTYDADSKTIEVVISKRDRAWRNTWEVIPDKMKNDKFFTQRWKGWLFDEMLKHVPVETPEGAPDWLVKVAEIINNIYA